MASEEEDDDLLFSNDKDGGCEMIMEWARVCSLLFHSLKFMLVFLAYEFPPPLITLISFVGE